MTKVKELWEKVKGFFKNMSMKVRIILCAAVTVLLVAIIALAVWSSSRDTYTTLFTNLSSTEASAIMSYLQENNFTDYRLEGDTIFVRAGQEDILMAQLVQAGYPKNGYLYETYFEKVGMTTTQSQANETLKIALEQKLEEYERRGWAAKKDRRWHLTAMGFLISNQLIGDLMAIQEAATLENTLPKLRAEGAFLKEK